MWKIAKKDLHIFFKDRKALFLSLLLPIGLITLFALAFGGIGQDSDEAGTPITVLVDDRDGTDASQRIIADLDSIPGIACVAADSAGATSAIRGGDEIAALLVGKGFADALRDGSDLPVTLLFDQSREMEVSILQNLLISRLSAIKGEMDADKGIDRVMASSFSTLPAEMQDSVRGQLQQSLQQESAPEQLVRMEGIVGDTDSNWGLIQAVAGTAILMLLFSVSAIGKSMLEEKESGVLKKLLQSPIHPFSILFGKMLTAVITAIFQLIILFLFSWIAFDLDILLDVPSLLLMIVVTAVTCSAFGVFLASVVTTKKQADSLGTILILFMSAIGGSMIPLYIMPAFMQDAAVISVNYWSIQGFYDIFWREAGMEAILDNVLVLTAMAAGILLVSLYFFRRNILRLV